MFLLLVLLLTTANAQLVSNTLGSYMVLQRAPASAALWGWTLTPEEKVIVTFNNHDYATLSSASAPYYWSVSLPPTPAGGPYTINVTSQTDSVTLTDVLFGDVWLCSGQSNMQFTVSQAFNATEEIANATGFDNIRLFTVGQGNYSLSALPQLASIEQGWVMAGPSSVGGPAWAYFSAVCWFFGRGLYDRYGVPIGLISTNWGGTIVQAWSGPDVIDKCGTDGAAPPAYPNVPEVLWNAMIVPFLEMPITGVVWYQGEANVNNATYYSCAFPAMIADWRKQWTASNAVQDFAFLYVQLAAYTQGGPYGPLLAELRQSQLDVLGVLPNVAMATAVDLGDLNSPYGNIHPENKQAVGQRLLLAAEAVAYGEAGVEWLGPVYSGFSVKSGPPAVEVEVSFDEDTLANGLVLKSDVICPPAVAATNECGWYGILSASGTWYNATASLGANQRTLVLTAEWAPGDDGTPMAVSYGFADWPVCNLYNTAGLPAIPFNSLYPTPRRHKQVTEAVRLVRDT